MDLASTTLSRQHEVARTNESSVPGICCALIFTVKILLVNDLACCSVNPEAQRQLEDTMMVGGFRASRSLARKEARSRQVMST